MDLLKKPALSPRVLRDPTLRRQLLVKLRQQSAMDARSAVHTHLVATAQRTLGVAVQTNDDTEQERRREGEWRKQKVEDGREGDGREYRERLYKYPAMFIFFCFFFLPTITILTTLTPYNLTTVPPRGKVSREY